MAACNQTLLDAVRGGAQVPDDGDRDHDALLSMVGERAFVLLGEDTHGTHGTHAPRAMRADITRRLIVEHGFDAVAAEANWPDAPRLDRHVRGGDGDDLDGAFADALSAPPLERAFGVIHRPESELASHDLEAVPGARFDAMFHLDETTAAEPFDVTAHRHQHEVPETWPSGLWR